MNALDFLFEFATLMSTSSAMTLPPNSNSVLDIPIQDISIPKETSNQQTQVCFSHEQNPQQGTYPQYNHSVPEHQLAYEMPSFPQHKDRTARVEPENFECQYSRSTEQQNFMQLPDFNRELPCRHGLEQQSQCTCVSPVTVCPPYGCAPPWETNQIHLQHQQRFQHSPQQGLPCEYDYGDRYLRQPCHRNYLPSHSYRVRDDYFPIVPQVTSALHQNPGTPVEWSEDGLAMYRDELFRY